MQHMIPSGLQKIVSAMHRQMER